ncbi:MAG: hypothetical protein HY291_22870 [Planctomycetes bacterium]|nr:hypothetical protein [Planctomycetota bacterium]
MTASVETPAENLPPTPPKPRVRWFFLGGLGMLAAGSALLYFFVADPSGTLPGFPQVWKGGPLLLGACFLGVYGALLLLLKRFSLGAMLLAAVLSAALTGGVHAYVYSFRESETREDSFNLPPEKLKDFLERSRTSLTSTRVTAFVLDLYATGHLKQAIDYDELVIQFGGDRENEWRQFLRLTFSWSPYVHPMRSQARTWAQSYAELANKWNIIRTLGVEPNANRWVQKYIYSVHELETTGLTKPLSVQQVDAFTEAMGDFLVDWVFMERLFSPPQRKTKEKMYVEGCSWLAEREPDPELKAFLEQVRDEIKRGRLVKPEALKTGLPPVPSKTSDEIETEPSE